MQINMMVECLTNIVNIGGLCQMFFKYSAGNVEREALTLLADSLWLLNE